MGITETSDLLRKGLLSLAVLMVVGMAADLAAERHWTQPIQMVAWVALAVLLVAVGLVARAQSPTTLRAGVVLALAVVVSSVAGIIVHVYANYDAGELDRRYAAIWETLDLPTKVGLAFTKSVGPTPPFAPGALAQAGLLVLLATVRHPVRGVRK